jgi:hypothetical protein
VDGWIYEPRYPACHAQRRRCTGLGGNPCPLLAFRLNAKGNETGALLAIVAAPAIVIGAPLAIIYFFPYNDF